MLKRVLDSNLLKNIVESKFKEATTIESMKIDSIRADYVEKRIAEHVDENGLITGNDSTYSIENTVKHNILGINPNNSIDRPMALLGPILGTNECVSSNRKNLKVLIIGPRNESEIFLYASHGFALDNIRGLDLIEYSEFIDVGDMHSMPYSDNSFDLVVCGWVMAYSKSHQLAANEIKRVVKNSGLVAIGMDVNPRTEEERTEYSEQVLKTEGYGYELRSHGYGSSNELLNLFKDSISHIIFNSFTGNKQGGWANILIKLTKTLDNNSLKNDSVVF